MKQMFIAPKDQNIFLDPVLTLNRHFRPFLYKKKPKRYMFGGFHKIAKKAPFQCFF